ncbi:hypothetical protein HDV57DRAFT_177920 [Trichoderma longibrachiatum]
MRHLYDRMHEALWTELFSPLGRPRRGSVTTVLFWIHTLPLPAFGNVNHHRQPPVQSRPWPPQPRCWAAASRSSDHIICSESKQTNAPDTSGLGLSAASHPLCLSGCRIWQRHDRQRFAVAGLRAAAKPAPARQPAPSYQLKIFGSGLGFHPRHLTNHIALHVTSFRRIGIMESEANDSAVSR